MSAVTSHGALGCGRHTPRGHARQKLSSRDECMRCHRQRLATQQACVGAAESGLLLSLSAVRSHMFSVWQTHAHTARMRFLDKVVVVGGWGQCDRFFFFRGTLTVLWSDVSATRHLDTRTHACLCIMHSRVGAQRIQLPTWACYAQGMHACSRPTCTVSKRGYNDQLARSCGRACACL